MQKSGALVDAVQTLPAARVDRLLRPLGKTTGLREKEKKKKKTLESDWSPRKTILLARFVFCGRVEKKERKGRSRFVREISDDAANGSACPRLARHYLLEPPRGGGYRREEGGGGGAADVRARGFRTACSNSFFSSCSVGLMGGIKKKKKKRRKRLAETSQTESTFATQPPLQCLASRRMKGGRKRKRGKRNVLGSFPRINFPRELTALAKHRLLGRERKKKGGKKREWKASEHSFRGAKSARRERHLAILHFAAVPDFAQVGKREKKREKRPNLNRKIVPQRFGRKRSIMAAQSASSFPIQRHSNSIPGRRGKKKKKEKTRTNG